MITLIYFLLLRYVWKVTLVNSRDLILTHFVFPMIPLFIDLSITLPLISILLK